MSLIDKCVCWRETAARGTGLEVAPCKTVREHYVERTDDASQADFWAVYARVPEGGAVWLADFDSRHAASQFAEARVEEYANLQEHGVTNCW